MVQCEASIGVLLDKCPGAEKIPVNLIRVIPAEERYDAVAVCPYGHCDRGDENAPSEPHAASANWRTGQNDEIIPFSLHCR